MRINRNEFARLILEAARYDARHGRCADARSRYLIVLSTLDRQPGKSAVCPEALVEAAGFFAERGEFAIARKFYSHALRQEQAGVESGLM